MMRGVPAVLVNYDSQRKKTKLAIALTLVDEEIKRHFSNNDRALSLCPVINDFLAINHVQHVVKNREKKGNNSL